MEVVSIRIGSREKYLAMVNISFWWWKWEYWDGYEQGIFATLIVTRCDEHWIKEMVSAQLTVSSLLGFNASLGQSLNLRGRKTMNQGSIMARMLRLARNWWSRHFEKEKKEKGKEERRSGDRFGQRRADRDKQVVGELRLRTVFVLAV
jgi:hypothetical protein